MDLDMFDKWAKEECLFIGTLMEKEGVIAVLQTCLQLGEEQLREHVADHADVMRDFFQMPRLQRAELLSRIEDKQELHAVLVALLHEARCASLLLEQLCKFGVSAGAIGSKSMMIGQAAAVAKEVAAQLPALYPFSEDQPFGMTPKWFSPDA